MLLVIGGVTLLALFLGGQGLFGQFVTDVLRPSFGQGAWLLGVLLIVSGVMVERSATVHSGWVVMTVGGILVFLAGEGLIHLISGRHASPADLSAGGGSIGQWLSATLTDLVGPAGAFLVLVGHRHRGHPADVRPDAAGVAAAGVVGRPGAGERDQRHGRGDRERGANPRSRWQPRTRPAPVAVAPPPPADRGRAKVDPTGSAPAAVQLPLPPPTPSPAPLSQTVWAGGAPDGASKPVAKAPVPAAPVATSPSRRRRRHR